MTGLQMQRQILDLQRQVERISTWDGAGASGGKQYATFVVAANDSTAAGKASADYVCDGTADQTEINSALSDATTSGLRRVLLLEGTFNLTGGLTVEADDMLEGQGFGSIVKLVSGAPTTTNAITLNSYCKVANLKVDGNSLSGSKRGIVADTKTGIEITGVWVTGFDDDGIDLDTCQQSRIVNNYITSNGNAGILLEGGFANVVVGNSVYYNTVGILVGSSTVGEEHSTISGNTCYSNTTGIDLTTDARYCTVDGNVCMADVAVLGNQGIILDSCEYNVVSNNIITGHSADGILSTFGNHNRIVDNVIVGNSWSTNTNPAINSSTGIDLDESDDNYISGNLIRTTLDGETYIQGYGIWVDDSNCNDNIILNNDVRGGGIVEFQDLGTNTFYRNYDGSTKQLSRTIATGVISVPGQGYFTLLPETGTADDLDTINGGLDGVVIYVRNENATNTVTLKDATGNLDLQGADVVLNAINVVQALIYDETQALWLKA